MSIEIIWHARRYWTMEPTGREQVGWNERYEACFVMKKTARRIYILSPSLGRLQLDRIAFEREGRVYHSRPHEWFYKSIPQHARRTVTITPAHEILGLQPGCSQSEIKRAYRRLSKTAHPDTGGSHDEFIRINKAYQELMR